MNVQHFYLFFECFLVLDGGAHLAVLRKPRARRLKIPPLDIVNKPFNERTEVEKDELYEKIAEQLAAIADQYNFESPRSSKSLSSPTSRTHSRTCSHSHSRSHSHSAPSQSETEEGAVGVVTEEKGNNYMYIVLQGVLM